MTSRAALLALALFAAGCDTTAAVAARVVDPSGVPVAGASVSFACPDHSMDGLRVATRGDGSFMHVRIPDIDAACTMTVEKAGFRPKAITRKDVSYRTGADPFGELPKVVLEPAK